MKTRSLIHLTSLLCAGLTATAQENKPAADAKPATGAAIGEAAGAEIKPADAKPAEAAKPAETAKPAEAAKPEAAPAAAAGEKAYADPSKLTEQAPEKFKVKLTTTKGDVIINCQRNYSPAGADRFFNLVKSGYFTDVAIFRVLPGFMAQFGIHGDPAISAKWRDANIPDEPVKGRNVRGAISFAKAGPNTRSTQLFISYGDNGPSLDPQGFSPFGIVGDEGMKIWESINSESGERPDQGRLQSEGNAYLKKEFPNLDYIKSASIVE